MWPDPTGGFGVPRVGETCHPIENALLSDACSQLTRPDDYKNLPFGWGTCLFIPGETGASAGHTIVCQAPQICKQKPRAAGPSGALYF